MELFVTFLKLVGIGVLIEVFCLLAAKLVYWLDGKYWTPRTPENIAMSNKGAFGCFGVFVLSIILPIFIGRYLGYSWGIVLIYLGQILALGVLAIYFLGQVDHDNWNYYD